MDIGRLKNKIITKKDLVYYIEAISQLRSSVFKNEKMKKSEVNKETLNILNLLEKNNIAINSQKAYMFLGELRKYLLSLPEIKMKIAFQPDYDFLIRISQLLEKYIGRKIILNIIFDPGIVGGAIIEYQGRYRNFSLAKEIDKVISQKKVLL